MAKRNDPAARSPLLLAGDTGGTNTRLALFSAQGGPRAPVAEAVFPSDHYTRLETIVQEFLERVGLTVDRACFAVAGPVVAGHATITNLPWVLDESTLRDGLKLASVRLLNDLEALAHAVPLLTSTDLHTLHAGEPTVGGTIAVIAPGTGLGEAFLTWDGQRYRAHPSEGGHVGFSPSNSVEEELLRFLRRQFDHVSVERVCSGIGIPNIYDFFSEQGDLPELPDLAGRLAAADDRTPLIVAAALDRSNPSRRCLATLDTFVSILGAEAGNLALKVLATGGVYLGGGIPPRILPALEDGRFLLAFRHKGRFTELVGRIPVHVITNRQAAVIGAAHIGLTMP